MIHRIAVIGEFQSGKSTLINCLLNDRVAAVGMGLPTTPTPVFYRFDEADFVLGSKGIGPEERWFEADLQDFLARTPRELWEGSTMAIVCLYNPLLQQIEIVDTPGPGWDQEAAVMTLATLGSVDLCLLVMTKGFPGDRGLYLDFLRQALSGRRYGLILNCGRECPDDPMAPACLWIEEEIHARLERLGLPPPVLSQRVNLRWIYEALILGDQALRRRRGLTVHQLLRAAGFTGLRTRLIQAAVSRENCG